MSKLKTRLIVIILSLLPVYLIKISFGWLSFNLLELLIGILFLLWIFNKNAEYKIPNTKYKMPVSLIFIGLALSVVANRYYYSGLGAIKGWFLFPIIFALIFHDQIKKDESLLRKSLLALFLSGVAVSAIGIVYKFLGMVTFDDRLRIFWDSPNQLAMFLAVPFLIGLALAVREERWSVKLLYIFGLHLIGLNIYYTLSYGAWIALFASAGIIAIRLNKNRRYFAAGVLLSAVLMLAVFSQIGGEKTKNYFENDGRSPLDSRITIWKSAGLMAKNNPLFGIGPGNFQNKYLEYQKYFPPYLEWSVPQPHNIFLAFWLQSGIIGFAGFVILLFYFFRSNKIAIKNNRDFGSLFLAIMIYILIHGLVDTTYWRNDLAVVFWMAMAANLYLTTAVKKPTV